MGVVVARGQMKIKKVMLVPLKVMVVVEPDLEVDQQADLVDQQVDRDQDQPAEAVEVVESEEMAVALRTKIA